MQVVPQQVSTRGISKRGYKSKIRTDNRDRNPTNKLKDTKISHKKIVNVQNVDKKGYIGVTIFVAVYIVLMIKQITTYTYQIRLFESRKEKDENSKLINQNDEPITDKYYMRGFYIDATSNTTRDEQKECTKLETKDAEKDKLDEDNNDKENAEENNIRKSYYIKKLKVDLFKLIYREFKQYRKCIKKQIKDEAKERTIGDVDTAKLQVIKEKLTKHTVADMLDSKFHPNFTLTAKFRFGYCVRAEVWINDKLFKNVISFVQQHLTAEEVRNLTNRTSSAKSFAEYFQSLKRKKDEEYTKDLYYINCLVLDRYLAYDEHVYMLLYRSHGTLAQQRYDRIWRNYPKGELQPQDRHYIISNSDATEDNLTTDHIMQAVSRDYYRCQLYLDKYKSAEAKKIELAMTGIFGLFDD